MLFSVIIPVFGQWHLTKNCLLSLRKEINIPFEVILVDNGANALPNDKTSEEALILGKELFNENFVYLPQKENLNFAGASNLGARNARTSLLFFLNNDTIVMKDFLPPLLEQFSDSSQKIMVGPLLMFPPINSSDYAEHIENDYRNYTIQHIGVYFNPQMQVGHIYSHLPASHRVAKRIKEFQCITGAAFFIRKKDFFEIDGFDERFINGFEDVDFCARFKQAGGRMFVNPKSKIVHLCSQTPGRKAHEHENSILLFNKFKKYNIQPDYFNLLENDGYTLHISEFLNYEEALNKKLEDNYETLIKENNYEKIKAAFYSEPFWKKGFEALINHPDANDNEIASLYSYKLKISFNFIDYLSYLKVLRKITPAEMLSNNYDLMELFIQSTEGRVEKLKQIIKNPNFPAYFLKEVQVMINDHDNFMQTKYIQTLAEIKKLIT